jgi:hypothetical protein
MAFQDVSDKPLQTKITPRFAARYRIGRQGKRDQRGIAGSTTGTGGTAAAGSKGFYEFDI